LASFTANHANSQTEELEATAAAPLVASEFRPLGTGGHLVVIPVDPNAPIGDKRYRISFAIDGERQLLLTVDDTVSHQRLFDNKVIVDLNEAAAPVVSTPAAPAAPAAIRSATDKKVVELNPNPSYNSLEVEVSRLLRDLPMEGISDLQCDHQPTPTRSRSSVDHTISRNLHHRMQELSRHMERVGSTRSGPAQLPMAASAQLQQDPSTQCFNAGVTSAMYCVE